MASATSPIENGLIRMRVNKLAGRAGESAQDQYPILVVPAGDELLGHEIHAVVERADDTEPGEPVQGHHVHGALVLLDVGDRLPAFRTPIGR